MQPNTKVKDSQKKTKKNILIKFKVILKAKKNWKIRYKKNKTTKWTTNVRTFKKYKQSKELYNIEICYKKTRKNKNKRNRPQNSKDSLTINRNF